MKYGTRLHPLSVFPDFDAITRFVQRAEALGYDFIAIPDHTIFPTEHEETMGRDWHDPLILAVHLAAVTRRIQLFTNVLVLPQYQPIRLAKQIATADHAARGRIEIGVGVGWLQEEIDLLGGDFANRGKMLEEYIAVLRNLWTTHPSTFSGRWISYDGMCCFPKPWQKLGPRILVGGSAHLSAPRAARIGDGWMPMTTHFSAFRESLAVLKAERAAGGGTLDDFSIYLNVPMFEMSEEVKEHTKHAGGVVEPSFAGDYDAAKRHFALCAEIGVTHVSMLLSTNYRLMQDQLETIAASILDRRQHIG